MKPSLARAGFGLAIAAVVCRTVVSRADAQAGETPQTNIEALKAALDAPGAPIVKAVYGNPGAYEDLGPPGPYFPDRAVRLSQGGVAILQCEVGKVGRLSNCKILAEGPTTFNFGGAALRMAATHYVRAAVGDGRPAALTEARIVVEFPTPKQR